MWAYRLRRLATLPAPELLLLMRAQYTLLRTSLRLRRRPPGDIVTAADSVRSRAARAVPPAELEVARAVERAVMRAATHGLIRPLCLVRAVALQSMLQSRGLHGSRVVVGVQLARGAFDAHAWVEYCGVVLGDSQARVQRFVPLAGADITVRP
jgi:hypothetical protein